VRAVPVVMVGVLAQDRLQVSFAVDEHPVGALGSCGAYPSLGVTVRPRGPRWDLDRRHALGIEDRVERTPDLLRASKTLQQRCGCGRKACSARRPPLSC
jgi:hypothetical protein